MERIIIFCILLICSCNDVDFIQYRKDQIKECTQVIEIDGCQYIVIYTGSGGVNPIHKFNCKNHK